MHHYGDDAVRAEVFDTTFAIEVRNHESGAAITIIGPREGVFQGSTRIVDRDAALWLGREFAHLLARVTASN